MEPDMADQYVVIIDGYVQSLTPRVIWNGSVD